MALTFTKDKGYERAPLFYQDLADGLLKREFNSFNDALSQKVGRRGTLYDYFQVMPVSVRPDTLPAIIKEAEIKIIIKEEGTGIILLNAPESALPILRAKAIGY